jgi:Domain of unknown function (DUF4388)
MSLSSSFRDFSLAELFQLVDQGRKSGCLTVCTLPSAEADSKTHYYYMPEPDCGVQSITDIPQNLVGFLRSKA